MSEEKEKNELQGEESFDEVEADVTEAEVDAKEDAETIAEVDAEVADEGKPGEEGDVDSPVDSDESVEDEEEFEEESAAPEPEQDFNDLDLVRLLPMLEALLFVAEDPLDTKEIAESITEVTKKNIPLLIQALDEYYSEHRRAFTTQRVAGGWRLATRPEFADVIRRHLRGKQRGRLSRASLETISIIAYRQPLSRPEIDQMRGVDSSPVVRNLLERELIKVVGRAEAPGRPILYATADKFLTYFGLESLNDLPKPEELLGSLEEEDGGTSVVNLRSGPFRGAGAGVEEETYRTDNGGTVGEPEPDEEQAPMVPVSSYEDEPEEDSAPVAKAKVEPAEDEATEEGSGAEGSPDPGEDIDNQ